ncbi:MGMT family protein [bacterium]|nr:MGMT family protein [candidate division CSSED10-310 bacterium]
MRRSWNGGKLDYIQRIHDIVRSIPPGRVATYGQIASIAGGCTARMVGYAMAAVTESSKIPWHRVVNSRGFISVRSGGESCDLQRELLENEGIIFDSNGRIDLEKFGF